MDLELKSREDAILSKFKEAKDRMDKYGYDGEYMHKGTSYFKRRNDIN